MEGYKPGGRERRARSRARTPGQHGCGARPAAGPSAPHLPLGGLGARSGEPEGPGGAPGGPGLTPGLPCPTASLLRRLGQHIQRLQDSSALGPKAGWLQQPLDPFNASDTRSFLQVRPREGESTAHAGPSAPCSVPQPLRPSRRPTSVSPIVTLGLLSVSLTAFRPAPRFLDSPSAPYTHHVFPQSPTFFCPSGPVLQSCFLPFSFCPCPFSLSLRLNTKATTRSQWVAEIWN